VAAARARSRNNVLPSETSPAGTQFPEQLQLRRGVELDLLPTFRTKLSMISDEGNGKKMCRRENPGFPVVIWKMNEAFPGECPQ
jgi:hypothetical protein